MLNITFGWIWITAGFATGAILGKGFHRETFMGGYNSWARRLTRLGHIAFFGTGLLNILVALTATMLDHETTHTGIWWIMSRSFIIGAVAMPICCFLAARWKRAKPVFAIPVIALTLGGLMLSVITLRAYLQGAP